MLRALKSEDDCVAFIFTDNVVVFLCIYETIIYNNKNESLADKYCHQNFILWGSKYVMNYPASIAVELLSKLQLSSGIYDSPKIFEMK